MLPTNRLLTRTSFALLCWVVIAVGCEAQAADREPLVRIVLRSAVAAPSDAVRLADMAELLGGNPSLRRQMAELDFEGPQAGVEGTRISREQVEIRLRLAGYKTNQFQILGADAAWIVLSATEPRTLDDAIVVAAIRKEFAAARGLQGKDLEIRLTEPLRSTALAASTRYPHVEVRPYLPAITQLGRQRLKVGLYESGRLYHTTDVAIQALLFQETAVTARALAAGEPIEADDIKFVRRAVTDQDMARAAGQVVGRRLRRGLPGGTLIQTNDLMPEKTASNRQPLVRRGDVITLIARSGRVTVKASSGEAMQEGRIGDQIRVKNVSSGRVVTGVVASRREVEVGF